MTDPAVAPPILRRPDGRWVAAAAGGAALLFAVLPVGPTIGRLVVLSVLGAGALGVVGVRRRAVGPLALAALLTLAAAVGVGAVLVARSLSPPPRVFPAPRHVVGMKLQAVRRAFLSHARVQFDIVRVPWADRNTVVRVRGLQWDGTYQDGTVIRLVVGTRPPHRRHTA
ncbi:MAG: hypothetical protein ACXVY5_02180 [Gaiellales bacterium]